MSNYSEDDTQPGKVIMRAQNFMEKGGCCVEYPTAPNCSDEESPQTEESPLGELDLYDECGILRPRYRDSPRFNHASDDIELAFKKIADMNGVEYDMNVPREQDQNNGRDLLPLVSEGGLVYGPRSFVMPFVACNIDDLTHCDPTPAEIGYLSDYESNMYLKGMKVKEVGGSGRKPLPRTRTNGTNGPEGPLLRPATGATFILARLRSFLYGAWGYFTALVYLMTHLFKCFLLTISVIYAGGLGLTTYHALRALIIVHSVLCILVAVWEFLTILHRAVFPPSSSTLPLHPDFIAIAGKEEREEEEKGEVRAPTDYTGEVEEDTKEGEEEKEELREEAKGNDAGYTEDDEDEELRQLEPTELSPLPSDSESAPLSDEGMSTQSSLRWLWRCFYEYVPLDCLYLPLFAFICLYLLSLYPLIT